MRSVQERKVAECIIQKLTGRAAIDDWGTWGVPVKRAASGGGGCATASRYVIHKDSHLRGATVATQHIPLNGI